MTKSAVIYFCASVTLVASDWSAPVDVLHEMKPCVTYRARLADDNLVIQASLQPGWHTFAIDNERRAAEKLAGKPSLGIDQPTQIKASKGLAVEGVWYQSPPKDFSKPELRWFSWGFEREALFAAKVRRSGPGPAQIEIRGQACTETTCKKIDVSLSVPVASSDKRSAALDLKTLIPVN
jgi:DsbC/DsbD-like thiol-disulfide interchange protein